MPRSTLATLTYKSSQETSYTDSRLQTISVEFGKAILATKPIPKGTILTIFNGERISTKKALEITASDSPNDIEDSNYIIQINNNLWLRPLKREVADYFNHCCEPNAGFLQSRKHADTLVAMRDIYAGEQVTYHYAFTDTDAPYEFDCHCGADSCTGKFSTSISQNPGFQEKYWDFLAPFLQASIIEQLLATKLQSKISFFPPQ